MPRGRPAKSMIRQQIVEVLFFLKRGTGYDIYKVYREIYPKVTLRSMYYNLSKGKDLGVFMVDTISKEQGEFSWGDTVEKIYYKLGPFAEPRIDVRVKEYLEKKEDDESDGKPVS